MEFLSLSHRRSSVRNVPSGEERGETDVFAGYRSTQREILRKRPKNNNKAWIKLSEAILSVLGDCWEKFISSSLPARLMEDFPASKVHPKPATWLTGKFPSRRMSKHYRPVLVWSQGKIQTFSEGGGEGVRFGWKMGVAYKRRNSPLQWGGGGTVFWLVYRS